MAAKGLAARRRTDKEKYVRTQAQGDILVHERGIRGNESEASGLAQIAMYITKAHQICIHAAA